MRFVGTFCGQCIGLEVLWQNRRVRYESTLSIEKNDKKPAIPCRIFDFICVRVFGTFFGSVEE